MVADGGLILGSGSITFAYTATQERTPTHSVMCPSKRPRTWRDSRLNGERSAG